MHAKYHRKVKQKIAEMYPTNSPNSKAITYVKAESKKDDRSRFQRYYRDIRHKVSCFDVCKKYGIELDSNNTAECFRCSLERNGERTFKARKGSFECTRCKAEGDCIQLVKLFFLIHYYDAAIKIGKDFNINYDLQKESERIKKWYTAPRTNDANSK